MSEPVWLTLELLTAIHERQLAEFGGPAGLRDRGALEPALDRPRNKRAYETNTLADLAAAYAFGIVKNHPFLDGNKRTGFLALVTVLGLNGVEFIADESQTAVLVRDIASGKVDERGISRWIGDNWPVSDQDGG